MVYRLLHVNFHKKKSFHKEVKIPNLIKKSAFGGQKYNARIPKKSIDFIGTLIFYSVFLGYRANDVFSHRANDI